MGMKNLGDDLLFDAHIEAVALAPQFSGNDRAGVKVMSGKGKVHIGIACPSGGIGISVPIDVAEAISTRIADAIAASKIRTELRS